MLLLGLLIGANTIYAQTTGDKIEKTAQKINNAIESFGGLFGKKNGSNSTTTKEVSGMLVGGLYTPGAITKATRYIECDYMEGFNRGAALIRKGTQYALIDKNGNFIVPYGKFSGIATELTSFADRFSGSGFFYATFFENNTEKRCIINAKGSIIRLLGDDGLRYYEMSPEKEYLLYSPARQSGIKPYMEVINFEGKTLRITMETTWKVANDAFRDDILVYGEYVNSKLLYGFKDLSDKAILKPTYAFMQPFNDGVAIIGQYNSLNQLRYGIIDKNGRVLVQPSYENKPNMFETGLASIRANDGTTAYINKHGKVLYKSTQGASWIKSGRIFENKTMIDTTGKTINVLDFLRQFGIVFKPNSNQEGYTSFQKNGYPDNKNQMRIDIWSSNTTGHFMGNYFFDAGTILAGSNQYLKDDVSNLIYTIIVSDKNKTEGYINAKGEFVYVKKPTQNTGL